MLQQTFFLLLNVSFPPCFLSPILISLSLSLSLFFFRGGGGGARRERPRLNPRLVLFLPISAKTLYNEENIRNQSLANLGEMTYCD